MKKTITGKSDLSVRNVSVPGQLLHIYVVMKVLLTDSAILVQLLLQLVGPAAQHVKIHMWGTQK